MPSFKDLTILIATCVTILYSTGHRDLVWKGIAYLRVNAIKEVRKPWGCPSIFDKNACTHRHDYGADLRKKYPTVHDLIYSSDK